jgi:hypothetical protein
MFVRFLELRHEMAADLFLDFSFLVLELLGEVGDIYAEVK